MPTRRELALTGTNERPRHRGLSRLDQFGQAHNQTGVVHVSSGVRPDPLTEWIGLELRHLAALRAIADEGSFKGAARVLGYTPSAISQQIASLERIVGTEVVAREQGRRALGPTDAGRILLSHLDAIVARLNAAMVAEL